MKFKSILLYTSSILLFLFGNREFWKDIQNEQEKDEKKQKAIEEAKHNLEDRFEVQSVVFDPSQRKLVNKDPYFQLIKVSGIASIPTDKISVPETASSTVKIETNDDENASDSN